MIRTFVTAAALLATAGPAMADPMRIAASYHDRTRLFCLDPADREATDPVHDRLYHRPCRNAGQWRAAGVRFDRPVRVALAAPAR